MTAADQTLAARDAADVAEAVGWANAQGKAIAVEGGGSKAGVGCPFAADLTLSLAGLSAIVDYEPSELVLTAQAGAPLAEIEALLATRGQQLAFEPIDHGPLFGAPPAAPPWAGSSPPMSPAPGGSRSAPPATISSASPASPAAARRSRPAARWSRTSPATTWPS